MRFLVAIFLTVLIMADASSQKPALDTGALGKWPYVSNLLIDADGKNAAYTIYNKPDNQNTLVIHSIENHAKKEFIGGFNGGFAKDKKFIFLKPNDSLFIVSLHDLSSSIVPNVSNYKLFQQATEEYVAYQLKGAEQQLVLKDLKNQEDVIFNGVQNYYLSNDGYKLLLVQKEVNSTCIQLLLLDKLQIKDKGIIWRGNDPRSLTFDDSGYQVAFLAEYQRVQSVWHYKFGDSSANILATDSSKELNNSLKIDGISSKGFSADGNRLFIDLKSKWNYTKSPLDKVHIWSYLDKKLVSLRQKEVEKPYLAVLKIRDREIVRLQYEGEEISIQGKKFDTISTIRRVEADNPERSWNVFSRPSYYIQLNSNAKRKVIPIEATERFAFSPNGQYLIGFGNKDRRNVYSYSLTSGKVRNLTESISKESNILEIAGWIENNEGLLIYDKFDIWKVDVSSSMPPLNITGYYGKRHSIKFRLCEDLVDKELSIQKDILLCAFNTLDKSSGFYILDRSLKREPEKLSMTDCSYSFKYEQFPMKADSANIYFLWRMKYDEAPNYFWTTDFVKFVPLTEVQPEKKYNWVKAELHSWKSLDGDIIKGILYKPENFDNRKKYPIIIHFYEELTDQLNDYLTPLPITGHLNIPWFVSNEYLVFLPDIYYKKGIPGKGALSSVVSAAKYLSNLSWVDTHKIGIQGHSWGGFEANYIITHSDLFAAAMSSSGPTNFVSGYGALHGRGNSLQYFYEIGQNRIGKTLWENPDLFIENSPVFRANKVSTPLLMMSNKQDGAVPFAQGVELYTALRRLGKKVWMLEYEDGKHTLSGSRGSSFLHTVMVTQFFDHYLKGKPPPKWMTRSIPVKMKRIDDGLELDTEIKTPGDGLLTPEEKKKVKALQKRKPITITLD